MSGTGTNWDDFNCDAQKNQQKELTTCFFCCCFLSLQNVKLTKQKRDDFDIRLLFDSINTPKDRKIKIGGRGRVALHGCPNKHLCEEPNGGFTLCNECMIEATNAINAKGGNQTDTNERDKRSGVISPKKCKRTRDSVVPGNGPRSGTEHLKIDKGVSCCDAHRNIVLLDKMDDPG